MASDKSNNWDVDKSRNETFQTYQNYLQEADAFNSYLRDVVAHTSRYVPEDQIWTMKSCGSQDSGVILGESLDPVQCDTRHENGNDDNTFNDIYDDDDNDENLQLDLQFAKCREGIRLFRESSVISRSSREPSFEDKQTR